MECWHGYFHGLVVGVPNSSLVSLTPLLHIMWSEGDLGTHKSLRPRGWSSLPTYKVKRAPHQPPAETSYADHPQLQEKFDKRNSGKCRVCFCSLVVLNLWSVSTSFLVSFLKQWVLCEAPCYLQFPVSAFLTPYHIHALVLFFNYTL